MNEATHRIAVPISRGEFASSDNLGSGHLLLGLAIRLSVMEVTTGRLNRSCDRLGPRVSCALIGLLVYSLVERCVQEGTGPSARVLNWRTVL